MWNDIYKPNSIGSEGGTIIADEEYKESCRITLERCERYDAITCGVYGCMMHTAFCDKSHSLSHINKILISYIFAYFLIYKFGLK